MRKKINRPSFEDAKRAYVHRYTMEHVPEWSRKAVTTQDEKGKINTRYYAPQYRTDKEWYEKTYFHGEHDLASKGYCYSHSPSWPLGEWLNEPYRKY